MKARKILVSLAALALVAAISIGGTLAYLTSKDTVTNTFTVGNVSITLDEAKVTNDGKVVEAPRQTSNVYKLMPGHEYTKDPKVHVAADSENSWLFVKVENGLAALESNNEGYTKIADQITANGWTALPSVDGVYYKEYTTQNTVRDEPVFGNFKIADNAQSITGWGNAADAKIIVTAYAIQKDGMADAADAWSKLTTQLGTK